MSSAVAVKATSDQTAKDEGDEIRLTKRRFFVLILVFVLSVVVVGLLAGLLRRTSGPACCSLFNPSPAPADAVSDEERRTRTPTQEEIWRNHRLPDYVLPDHYDLSLYPDFYDGAAEFYGNVSVRLNVTKDTDCVLVHIKALTVLRSGVRRFSADHEGESSQLEIRRNFSYTANEFWVIELRRELKAGSVVWVDMQFKGSLKNGINGLYKSRYVDSRTGTEKYLTTSKFQPTDARKAFPCLDEPGFKSTFNVTIVHRTNFTALSNMPEEATFDFGKDLKATRFEKSVPMVTYLVCFIVCDFDYRENATRRGIPLRVFATPDKIDQVGYALNSAVRILEVYEETYGLPFPLPKLDQIAIPDFGSGAMEHWGLITYRESSLLYDEREASVFNKQRVAVVVAHELAHMWFGNLVTMKWWDDLWLNEGFASYVEYLGVSHIHPDWDMDSQFLIEDMQPVMTIDSVISSHPIVVPVNHPDQISEAFDSISYSKGASILRMLQTFLGAENFKKGLQMYMKRYQYKITVTSDLWSCLSQVDGAPDVESVMNTWTMQMGFPVVSAVSVAGRIRLSQERFLLDPSSDKTQPPSEFKYIWKIPITWTSSSGRSGLVWLNDKRVIFDFKQIPANASQWIKFNVNGSSYVRMKYEESQWKTFSDALLVDHRVFSTSDRSNLIDDAFSLARAGQMSYGVVLNLVRYLSNETDYTPWKTLDVHATYIREMLQFTSFYEMWERFIRDLVSPVFRRTGIEQSGSHTQRMLRNIIVKIACISADRECLTNVTRTFRSWLKDGQYVSPDIRGIVYKYGMQEIGHEKEWNVLWHNYLTSKIPQEKNTLLIGLTQARPAWLLHRLLVYAWDETKIRSQDFFTVVSLLNASPLGRAIAWDWTRSNWSKLESRFSISNRYLGRMIPGIVSHFNTPFQLQEVEGFFARYPSAGAGERGRKQALDKIRANIAWMDRNVQDIGDWLENYA